MFKVIITPQATKQFKHLPKVEQIKIKKKPAALEDNLLSGKKLSGELAELRSLRAWPYRIIYYTDQKKQNIFITSILHHQGAYK
jgi:mRNA-degrading endonuclease RelE of RelBE toxin-antitoxin system